MAAAEDRTRGRMPLGRVELRELGEESLMESSLSKGRRFVTLAFGVLALVVAGCGDSNDSGSKTGSSTGSSTTASSEPFKILTVLPKSGPFAVGGQLEINAWQAAVNV